MIGTTDEITEEEVPVEAELELDFSVDELRKAFIYSEILRTPYIHKQE